MKRPERILFRTTLSTGRLRLASEWSIRRVSKSITLWPPVVLTPSIVWNNENNSHCIPIFCLKHYHNGSIPLNVMFSWKMTAMRFPQKLSRLFRDCFSDVFFKKLSDILAQELSAICFLKKWMSSFPKNKMQLFFSKLECGICSPKLSVTCFPKKWVAYFPPPPKKKEICMYIICLQLGGAIRIIIPHVMIVSCDWLTEVQPFHCVVPIFV